jgi:hypothetical protein
MIEYIIDNLSSGDIYLTGTAGQTIEEEVIQTIPSQSAINCYAGSGEWRIF